MFIPQGVPGRLNVGEGSGRDRSGGGRVEGNVREPGGWPGFTLGLTG